MRRTMTALMLAGAMALPGGALADATDLEKMDPAERNAFRNEVRAYLLENPEVIFEAIQILEERRAVAAAQEDRDLVLGHAEALYDDGFSWIGGNPDGDVTVVEFLDYRCGYCKRAHPEVQELLDRDPNVRLIVKEFPILGPNSVRAGKMALAALEIDPMKYKALNDELMSFEGELTESVAYRIAAELGYDIETLKELAGSPKIDDRINRNYQLASVLGIQGTPAFIIGTEVVRGYIPVDQMLNRVGRARAAQN